MTSTGYTAGILDGSITSAKDYLLRCTRAFGIAIDLKDEPLSVPTPMNFVPDPIYTEQYERQLIRVHKIQKMNIEEMREEYHTSYSSNLRSAENFLDMMLEANAKFEPILTQVKAWNPPEAFSGIKKFAIDQIEQCLYSQKWIDDAEREIKEIKDSFNDSDEAINSFKEDMLAYETKELELRKKSMDKAAENAKSRTLYMQNLVKSLEDLE